MKVSKSPLAAAACLCSFALCGCSAKDPVNRTPYYHVGTPTNRSSVNSWEINQEPYYTQPGVAGGKPVILKTMPSQRGFEPNDPLALAVYYAVQNAAMNVKYLAPSAKDGVVILDGTTDSAAGKAKIEEIARATPGVKKVISHLRIVQSQ